jgi:hypothetical protein
MMRWPARERVSAHGGAWMVLRRSGRPREAAQPSFLPSFGGDKGGGMLGTLKSQPAYRVFRAVAGKTGERKQKLKPRSRSFLADIGSGAKKPGNQWGGRPSPPLGTVPGPMTGKRFFAASKHPLPFVWG